MIKKFNEFVNEGFLARLTKEYVGETTRDENRINIDGVDCFHSFTDMNGKFHKHGYYIENGSNNKLKELIKKLIETRGNEADLNDIDVSNVEDMGYIFFESFFNGDLSGWDVSNVTDFYAMFCDSKFNNHSIDNWKFSTEEGKEISLYGMFFQADCSNIDISNWNVERVFDFSHMFENANFDGDLSRWDVSNGKKFYGMFSYSKFNNHSIDNWKFSTEEGKEITFSNMFMGSDDGSRKDCSNIDPSNWNVERVFDFSYMFKNTNFDGDLSRWDISNGESFLNMFENCPIKDEHKPKKVK